MSNEQHSRQMEEEGIDWLYTCLSVGIIVALILASVVGHAVVSVGVVQ